MMSILLDPTGRSLRTSGSEIPESALLRKSTGLGKGGRFLAEFFSLVTPPSKMLYQTAEQLNANNGRSGGCAILLDPLCDGCEPTRTRPRNDIVWSERANRFGKECLSK